VTTNVGDEPYFSTQRVVAAAAACSMQSRTSSSLMTPRLDGTDVGLRYNSLSTRWRFMRSLRRIRPLSIVSKNEASSWAQRVVCVTCA
jgi:hypothetical protein